MATKTPSLAEFKAFAISIRPAVLALIEAKAFAELERERVDAYATPLLKSYGFTTSEKYGRPVRSIEKTSDLYLVDDLKEPLVLAFYEDLYDADKAHGWKGERGKCPALVAEHAVIEAERHVLTLSGDLFGVDVVNVFGDLRKKWLDNIIGASLKDA